MGTLGVSNIYLNGTGITTNLAAITNLATAGTYLYANTNATGTNYSWQALPVSNRPYLIPFAASQNVAWANGNYQKAIVTNTETLYFVNPPDTNNGASMTIDVDRGTNAFGIGLANLCTNGLGSVTNLVFTNSGVSTFIIWWPAAGTNRNVVGRGYNL
jgi:hypothetical protein